MSDDHSFDAGDDVDASGSLVSGPEKRQVTAVQKVGVAALVLVIALAFIWLGARSKAKRVEKTPEVAVSTNANEFKAAPIVLPPPPSPPPPAVPAAPDLPMPVANSSLIPAQRREPTPAESPIFAFSGGSTGGPAHPVGKGPGSTLDGNHDGNVDRGSQQADGNALSDRLKPTIVEPRKATLLPHPDFMITQGTIIPCVLQTAIDTNLAGFVKCILPQDIRGTTGNVVLLDRGTTVIGEIQKGLQPGDARVFVLWDRAETPDHAVIALASPGSDELGRTGLPGKINNHFWQRFGGTVLLSVVQGVFQAGTALAGSSGGGGGMNFNSFQSNGEQAADTALRSSINIPPTLEKNQGDTASIFVAQDLDFSEIYSLRYTSRSEGWKRVNSTRRD